VSHFSAASAIRGTAELFPPGTFSRAAHRREQIFLIVPQDRRHQFQIYHIGKAYFGFGGTVEGVKCNDDVREKYL